MFVGKAGAGKHRYARALEKALFDEGRNAYMLDGSNVLLGVDHDLPGSTPPSPSWCAGSARSPTSCSTRASSSCRRPTPSAWPTRRGAGADPRLAELLIDIDPDGASTQACDLRIRGTEPEAEVIAQITELLERRQITSIA